MENSKDFKFFVLRLAADSAVILGSWFVAYYVRFHIFEGGIPGLLPFFSRVSLLVLLIYIYMINRNGLYAGLRSSSWVQELQLLLYSALVSDVSIVLMFYFFFPERVSRLTLILFGVISLLGVTVERKLVNRYLNHVRRKGRNRKTVLFVGYGHHLREYYDRLQLKGDAGLAVIGQVDSGNEELPGVTQYTEEVLQLVHERRPDVIVIGYPASEYRRAQARVNELAEVFASVIFIPSMVLSSLSTRLSNFYNIPVVHVNHINFTHFDRIKKRAMDLLLSSMGLILLSPFFLVIAILIKLTSPGPVFYTQERVSIDEKLFDMIKFRSMRAEPSSERLQWTVKDDPRCTAIGRFMRKTSIDELPQLINVLKGEMSLIGPRPERKEFVQQFNSEIPGYPLRHKAKTGISGWAQVNGLRGDTSLTERIDSDLYYIRNWSIGLDLKILVMTVFKGFVNKNAY